MRLTTYEGYLQDKVNTDSRQAWIVPSGHMKKAGTYKNTKYCPECLKENGYFKKSWRLHYVNVCVKHKCYLLNECPQCGSPVSFLNIGTTHSLSSCGHCGFDYRAAPKEKCRNRDALVVKDLHKIAKDGYFLLDDQWHYSLGFFFVLRILLARVNYLDKKTVGTIVELDPKRLNKHLIKAMELLNDWPNSLIKFCKDNKLTNRQAVLDKYRYRMSDIPRWFLDGLDRVIEVQMPKSDEEIVNMFKWLEKNNMMKLREISEISGWGIGYCSVMKDKYLTYPLI